LPRKRAWCHLAHFRPKEAQFLNDKFDPNQHQRG
jgi:hypothetical protein